MDPLNTLLVDLTDLHIHLGASSTPHFLWQIAHDQGIRLPEKNYWKFIELARVNKKTTSEKYLKKIGENKSPFYLTHKIQSYPYAVERCVREVISRQYRKSDVRTIEIRFNPMLRTRGGEYDLDKIILSALVGLRKGMIEYPVKAGLIFESDRQFNEKQHLIIVKKAIKFKELGVVGIDISGPTSKDFSIDSLVKSFKMAKRAGLGTTIHTGEFPDVDEMEEVITKLNPDRIGHGVKAIKSKRILNFLAKKKIVLEICPTSNIRTRVVKNWGVMKKIIKTFQRNKVLFTINTDGPEFLRTTVKEEYKELIKRKIISHSEAKKIINLSHQASFIK